MLVNSTVHVLRPLPGRSLFGCATFDRQWPWRTYVYRLPLRSPRCHFALLSLSTAAVLTNSSWWPERRTSYISTIRMPRLTLQSICLPPSKSLDKTRRTVRCCRTRFIYLLRESLDWAAGEDLFRIDQSEWSGSRLPVCLRAPGPVRQSLHRRGGWFEFVCMGYGRTSAPQWKMDIQHARQIA